MQAFPIHPGVAWQPMGTLSLPHQVLWTPGSLLLFASRLQTRGEQREHTGGSPGETLFHPQGPPSQHTCTPGQGCSVCLVITSSVVYTLVSLTNGLFYSGLWLSSVQSRLPHERCLHYELPPWCFLGRSSLWRRCWKPLRCKFTFSTPAVPDPE